MDAVTWYQPDTIDEAVTLASRDGLRLHGGGTYLLRTGLGNTRGLIDLSRLNLDGWQAGSGGYTAGAMMTLSDLSRNTRGTIVSKAAVSAATTPLRNRITLGGTVSAAPPWSDIMGPLIALDARVTVFKGEEATIGIDEYLANRKLNNALVTRVTVPGTSWRFYYHRETRTRVDYPAFTVTVLAKGNGAETESRIVVWGCKGRWMRLTALEDAIAGSAGSSHDIDWAEYEMPDFAARPLGSGGYLRHCAGIAVKRGVLEVLN